MLRESNAGAEASPLPPAINVDGSDSSGLRNQGLLYFENLFGDSAGQVPVGADYQTRPR